MDELNILIAGVGGQGNILASKIICNVAIKNKEKVRIGETYGASQRGGSVLSHVRIGEKVFGPLVPYSRGDIVLGFEPMECVRQAVNFLKFGGIVVCNTRKLYPIEVTSGMMEYPDTERLILILKKLTERLVLLDATHIAEIAGDRIALNMVMLGALTALKEFPFEKRDMKEEIRETMKFKYDVNEKAFDLGFEEAKNLIEWV